MQSPDVLLPASDAALAARCYRTANGRQPPFLKIEAMRQMKRHGDAVVGP